MADRLYLGKTKVTPAIVKKEVTVPNYIAPKNNVNGVYGPDNTATSFNLNGATDVSDHALARAFQNCTNLTSVDLSSLTTISGSSSMYYCFSGCSNLTSVDLSSLTMIRGYNAMAYCFASCANLTSVDFPSLTTITGTSGMSYCFGGCTSLTELRFPALQSFGGAVASVNQFSNMLSGVTGCTLHFPSNMQSEVERRSGYPNFGGTNTVVLFDLPATA